MCDVYRIDLSRPCVCSVTGGRCWFPQRKLRGAEQGCRLRMPPSRSLTHSCKGADPSCGQLARSAALGQLGSSCLWVPHQPAGRRPLRLPWLEASGACRRGRLAVLAPSALQRACRAAWAGDQRLLWVGGGSADAAHQAPKSGGPRTCLSWYRGSAKAMPQDCRRHLAPLCQTPVPAEHLPTISGLRVQQYDDGSPPTITWRVTSERGRWQARGFELTYHAAVAAGT
ncbi:uncharacterized protein LOC144109849 [Amblyomma americanum]